MEGATGAARGCARGTPAAAENCPTLFLLHLNAPQRGMHAIALWTATLPYHRQAD